MSSEARAERSSHGVRSQSPSRLTRPELFMTVAELYGMRSSCPRANVGVVAVNEGRIVAAGYCGAPSGIVHCTDYGCTIVNDHCVNSVHAEANMIAWAARTGTCLLSTDVYCTHAPCLSCAQLMGNAGIKSLTWKFPYHDDESGLNLLLAVGLEVTRYEPRR